LTPTQPQLENQKLWSAFDKISLEKKNQIKNSLGIQREKLYDFLVFFSVYLTGSIV
jgi:hypothetical protein